MRAEISKATKENKEFVRNIQKAKELEGIQSKAAAKKSRSTDAENTNTSSASTPAAGVVKATIPESQETVEARSLRKFKQSTAGKKKGAGASSQPTEAAKRVLSQLF